MRAWGGHSTLVEISRSWETPHVSSAMGHSSTNEHRLWKPSQSQWSRKQLNLLGGRGGRKETLANLRRPFRVSLALSLLGWVQKKNGTRLAARQSHHSRNYEGFDDKDRRETRFKNPRRALRTSIVNGWCILRHLLCRLSTGPRRSPNFFVKGEDKDCVIAALLGQVKGEHGEREYLLPMASTTRSGIKARSWMRRVIVVNQRCDRESGPALCDDNGTVLKSRDMNEVLHDLLGEIFVEHPAFFDSDIQSISDIEDKHSVCRSFCRGSDYLAIAMKVPSEDVKVVNRWSRKEASGTSKVSMDMTQCHADTHVLLPSFMRCTGAM